MPQLRRISRPNGNVATFVIKENEPQSCVEHSQKHKGTYGLLGVVTKWSKDRRPSTHTRVRMTT
jgi:hypothetical protein